jgi:hypothetical protein
MDTIKKVTNLISYRKAPKTLVLAMQILVFVICASIGISIFAATQKVKSMNVLKEAIVDSNEINQMNIKLNKISTFLEMEKLMDAPYNIDFETEYTAPIFSFIKEDMVESFNQMEELYEGELTSLNLDTASHDVIQNYFFLSDTFQVRTISSELSYLNYLNYCLESLSAYLFYHEQATPVGVEP